MNKIKTIVATTLLVFPIKMFAQQTIPASGGNAQGIGGTVSYSVGQVVYTSITGTNGSVAEGVQKPYEISVVTAIKEAIGINLSVSAYPNPATNYVVLWVEDVKLSTLTVQLFDMAGKLLQNKKITSNETTIALEHLAASTYLVKVVQGNKEVKTFKIIKN